MSTLLQEKCHKRSIINYYNRMIPTDRIHKDEKGKDLCKIYTLAERPTKYPPNKLVELRKLNGVGNVRKISKV